MQNTPALLPSLTISDNALVPNLIPLLSNPFLVYLGIIGQTGGTKSRFLRHLIYTSPRRLV